MSGKEEIGYRSREACHDDPPRHRGTEQESLTTRLVKKPSHLSKTWCSFPNRKSNANTLLFLDKKSYIGVSGSN